ncbi:MAG: hypothetical protein HND52_14140 [Ignavibacteriae bacterium]|nr:hypothetical protein [Ignavibacteriota bacterium]NOG99095.1 hypothetical protein [Ignavibacteriota bacterium]
MERIVFLSYINRSGSTYLANKLSKNPNIFVCPEAEILISFFLVDPSSKVKLSNRRINYLMKDPKFKHWAIDENHKIRIVSEVNSNLEKFLTIIISLKEKLKPKAEIIIFQGTMLRYLFSRIIKNSKGHPIKMINLIRDPRAVFQSQKQSLDSSSNIPMNTSPRRFSNEWCKYSNLLVDDTDDSSEITVKYEEMITNENRVYYKVIDFLEVNHKVQSETPSDLNNIIPGSQRHLHPLINKRPDSNRIKRWEKLLNNYEINEIQEGCGLLMQKFNYTKTDINVNRIKLFFVRIYWACQRYYYLVIKYFRKVIQK